MSTIIDDKIVASAQSPSSIKEDPIVALTEKVNNLYLFRDSYFENYPIEDAIKKDNRIEAKMKDTLNKFDEYKGYEIDGSRAKYFYLKGRTLNVLEQFSPQAEELLSKAVKLEPGMVEAWNELGECYWRNNDIQQAKNCFMGALQQAKNKVSLRSLSVIIRQDVPQCNAERSKNVQLGIDYAKEAIRLDPNDGVSWGILGNAYLSHFFTVLQEPVDLRLALSAYAQAEKDKASKNHSDLFYNKGVTLKYLENYHEALIAFDRAVALDPEWVTTVAKRKNLLEYLQKVQDCMENYGKIKAKKLQQMIEKMDSKHLGPYKDDDKWTVLTLKDLKTGINKHQLVMGIVVCWMEDPDFVPFTFCIVDKEKTCVAVTVYNMAKGREIKIGDVVVIPAPNMSHNSFTYKDQKFEFKSIRVESPLILVINGKLISRDQQASPQLKTMQK